MTGTLVEKTTSIGYTGRKELLQARTKPRGGAVAHWKVRLDD